MWLRMPKNSDRRNVKKGTKINYILSCLHKVTNKVNL